MTICEAYDFINDGGRFSVDGKSYFPNMIRFSIAKRNAVGLAMNIMDKFHRDVQTGEYDPNEMVQFAAFGILVREPDDDIPHPHRDDHAG